MWGVRIRGVYISSHGKKNVYFLPEKNPLYQSRERSVEVEKGSAFLSVGSGDISCLIFENCRIQPFDVHRLSSDLPMDYEFLSMFSNMETQRVS